MRFYLLIGIFRVIARQTAHAAMVNISMRGEPFITRSINDLIILQISVRSPW